MNTPMTAEYAYERLKKALKSKDIQEIEKWDYILRSENDFRVLCKERDREIKNRLLQSKLRALYRTI